MIGVTHVSAATLNAEVAADLKKRIQMPEWAHFVKTGLSRQKAPTQEDWWWMRAASLLRRICIDGPVGVNRLRTFYGGRKDRGSRPEKTCQGSGKILRTILKQLETQKLVKPTPKGRVLTPEGQSYLDKMAKRVKTSGTGKSPEA
ncbi:MAG TPA: 30S ribosomal protein S19e [archaeon]|nr:30S ribosomal protein S19e [archaeon]